MKYCQETTLKHPIATEFLDCLKPINIIINKDIANANYHCFEFTDYEIAIYGDLVEEKTAKKQFFRKKIYGYVYGCFNRKN